MKCHELLNLSFSLLPAGSAGDPNAPQLIVENRAVVLDYAKDRNPLDRNPNTTSSVATKAADWACSKCQCLNFARRNECFKCSTPKTEDCAIVTGNTLGYGSDHLNVAMKADWICSKCQCQNFAKRHECFKCLAPRSEDCITVSVNQTPDSDQITNAVSNSYSDVQSVDFLTFVLCGHSIHSFIRPYDFFHITRSCRPPPPTASSRCAVWVHSPPRIKSTSCSDNTQP